MRLSWNLSRRSSAVAATLAIALTGSAFADDVCGDFDGDNDCDVPDLGIILASFGKAPGDPHYNDNADLDGDGDVDQADLAWFIMNIHCPYDYDCMPCEPTGVGELEVDLVAIDNTDVGLGDDTVHPEFHGGVTHFTFDLVAEVTGMNDWTTQSSTLERVGDDLGLFMHEFGSDAEPQDFVIDLFPALAYDTFYAGPPELFDANHPDPVFATPVDSTPPILSAVWSNLVREGEVTSTVQRFTLIITEDSGMVPSVAPDDCAHDYAVLARIMTDATSSATGADFLHRSYLIVDLAQPTCPGDVDLDGDVDQSDLGILLVTYERPSDDPLYDDRADFDCDGDVDQSDLGTLLAAYGGDC
jgi:hypothetical protein